MKKKTRKYICIVVFGCLLGYTYSTIRDNRSRPLPCQLAGETITATRNQCEHLNDFFKNPSDAEKPISAAQYYKAFNDHEIRAESTYLGKLVAIHGTISAVRIDSFDNLTINLKAGYNNVRLELGDIQLTGNPIKAISAEEKMLQLDVGQKIKAVCIGGHKVFITPVLKNCIIER